MSTSAILLLRATPEWLDLSIAERADIRVRDTLTSLREGERLVFLDHRPEGPSVTDVAYLEVASPHQWLWALDRLRATELFDKPYMRLVGVLPASTEGGEVDVAAGAPLF